MSTEQETVERASSWCASHGILMGSSVAKKMDDAKAAQYVYEPAPFSLHPTPYPKSAFDTAYNMSSPFNRMVHNVAESYTSWIKNSIETAAKGDAEFTGKMVELADEVIEHGKVQHVVLGILRSDYMLHSPQAHSDPDFLKKSDADRIISPSFKDAIPLQVELNTIASSFGCLSSKITTMHQALQDSSHVKQISKELGQENSKVPNNKAWDNIVDGLAAAFLEYNTQKVVQENTDTNTESVILMIVYEGDTNSCDQREVEFLLQKEHNIRLIRRTLHEIATLGKYNSEKKDLFQGKELLVPDGKNKDDTVRYVAVAVAYFRAGYTPEHYPSNIQWEGRRKLEHSAAIKCPDIFYHLVGAKKIQQQLAAPNALGQFCQSPEEEDLLKSTFAGLYALGENDSDDAKVMKLALESPHSYVLKPQREGGGNNLYDDELVHALQTMSKKERGGYILMQKILPPSIGGVLVRGGQIVFRGETVCEIGVFGVSLREYSNTDNADNDGEMTEGRVLFEKTGGHILRSKSIQTDEGGVAAGYACLSSPLLV